MNIEIKVALIAAAASAFSAVFAFLGVVFSNKKSNTKIEQRLEVAQAVTDTKIDELTREVRLHNNFAQRMPLVEQAVKDIKDDVSHLKKYHEEKV